MSNRWIWIWTLVFRLAELSFKFGAAVVHFRSLRSTTHPPSTSFTSLLLLWYGSFCVMVRIQVLFQVMGVPVLIVKSFQRILKHWESHLFSFSICSCKAIVLLFPFCVFRLLVFWGFRFGWAPYLLRWFFLIFFRTFNDKLMFRAYEPYLLCTVIHSFSG